MEDLIILGKVVSISDDINNPKLSSNPPFFMNAVVEIHKVLGGRFSVSYKDIYDTSDKQLPFVIVIQFATAWEDPLYPFKHIKFDLDQKGIFVLSVSGKKKFLAKHFEKR